MKCLIIDTYSFTYANGITQSKNLITRKDYEDFVIPVLDEIYLIEIKSLKLKKNSSEYQDLKKHLTYLKKKLASLGEYFTDNSPMGKTIETGIISLPPHQGGDHSVKIKKNAKC